MMEINNLTVNSSSHMETGLFGFCFFWVGGNPEKSFLRFSFGSTQMTEGHHLPRRLETVIKEENADAVLLEMLPPL